MSTRKKSFYIVYKYVHDGNIIYIGKSENIVQRINQHAKCKDLDMKFGPYIDKVKVYVHECANKTEMDALEILLINKYKPVLNISFKTNDEVSFRIDDSFLDWKEYIESDYQEYANTYLKLKKNGFKPIRLKSSPFTTAELVEMKDKITSFLDIIKRYPTLKTEVPWDARKYLPSSFGVPINQVNIAFAFLNLTPIPQIFCGGYGATHPDSMVGSEGVYIHPELIDEILLSVPETLWYIEHLLKWNVLHGEPRKENHRGWRDLDLLPGDFSWRCCDLRWENIKKYIQ